MLSLSLSLSLSLYLSISLSIYLDDDDDEPTFIIHKPMSVPVRPRPARQWTASTPGVLSLSLSLSLSHTHTHSHSLSLDDDEPTFIIHKPMSVPVRPRPARQWTASTPGVRSTRSRNRSTTPSGGIVQSSK